MVTRTLIIQPAETVSNFELFCLFEAFNECVSMHSSIEVQVIDLFARGVRFPFTLCSLLLMLLCITCSAICVPDYVIHMMKKCVWQLHEQLIHWQVA